MDDHKIPLDELCRRHNTNIEMVRTLVAFSSYFAVSKGMTPHMAAEVLKRDGPNAITPPKVTPEWLRFAQNMFGWFNVLLWMGSILCLAAYIYQIYTLEPEEVPVDNVSQIVNHELCQLSLNFILSYT